MRPPTSNRSLFVLRLVAAAAAVVAALGACGHSQIRATFSGVSAVASVEVQSGP
jgi:hypothetical protein